MKHSFFACAVFLFGAASAFPLAMDPWADAVVAFDPGTGAAVGYTNTAAVVGSPAISTSFGPVHMFSAPWETSDLVSIGDGGFLTVAFDEPIEDNPLNPFGIDLLIFGNAGFLAEGPTYDSLHTSPAGLFGADGGTVEVSSDGTVFVEVVGAIADGLFPTQPWADGDETAPANFARPVSPALAVSAFDGLTIDEALALYAGSGGGAGIDLAGTGLSSVRYVRVSHLGPGNVEVDAFADVASIPEPGALLLASLGAVAIRSRRHRPQPGSCGRRKPRVKLRL